MNECTGAPVIVVDDDAGANVTASSVDADVDAAGADVVAAAVAPVVPARFFSLISSTSDIFDYN